MKGKENRSAEGDVKKRLELRIQKRIGMMDTYYQQLAKTLAWSRAWCRCYSIGSARLKKALFRSKYLTNAILYTDTQRQDLEARLSFVNEKKRKRLLGSLNVLVVHKRDEWPT